MIRSALYAKDSGHEYWRLIATDYLEEHERQDFRDAAIRFEESDRSFGQERAYVYVVLRGLPPRFVYNMDIWEKL